MVPTFDPDEGTAVWLRRRTKRRLEALRVGDESMESVLNRVLDELERRPSTSQLKHAQEVVA